MKKLALIMLAVVSMALVSCGGGGRNNGTIQSASPAIIYKSDGSKIDGYFKVTEVSARVQEENTIMATAILEVVKDIPEMWHPYFSTEKLYEYSYTNLSIFDKDMMTMGEARGNQLNFLNKKKGETVTLSSTIKIDMPSNEAIKKVKFVQVTIDGVY